MNKKIFSGILLSTVMLTGGMSVNASSTDIGTESDVKLEVGAGITPGSFLYQFDKGWENFRLKIASDDKKAQLLLEFAEERLSELNGLSDEDVTKYADELYQEYGANLEQVSNRLAEQVALGKVDEKLAKVKEKLDRVATLDQAVKEDKVSSVSDELKVKVNNTQTKSYALSIVTNLDQSQVDSLKEQGFGYGEIIKLQAFAELSGKSIEELTFLDIYVTNEDGEKEIDFGKLAIELGLVKLDENGQPIVDENGEVKPNLELVKEQFKQYKDVVKKIHKDFEELNEAAKKELEARKEEARREFSEKVNAKLEERLADFNTKIEEIFNIKVEIINNLDENVINADRKAELINQLTDVKTELLAKVTNKVSEGELEPGDLGELNAEIHKEFNGIFKELLSDEEEALVLESLDDVVNQAKPMFNQIVTRFEEKNHMQLSDEQIILIWSEVKTMLSEKTNDEKSSLVEDLDEKVYEIIKDLLDIKVDSDRQIEVNVNAIFEEILDGDLIKKRLDEKNLEIFTQQIENAKDEILANIDNTQGKFQIKMAIVQEIIGKLDAYLKENDIANANVDTALKNVLDGFKDSEDRSTEDSHDTTTDSVDK